MKTAAETAVLAGVAVVDITPAAGLSMAGFAARTEPATGSHDPLTVRALVVEDTALVCVDVIGLTPTTCRHIREGCVLPADRVVVTALHTHGGPGTMPGQLGDQVDTDYLRRLEEAAIEAINSAHAQRRAVTLHFGQGSEGTVAKNRRHADGPVDKNLPVLALRDEAGDWLAVLCSYACHPVVLGSDNRQWTADYPGFVRQALEQRYPGAVAVFVTGCAGDLNTGHAASASFKATASAQRTFAEAERIGQELARAVADTELRTISRTQVRASATELGLGFVRREKPSNAELAEQWRQEAQADPAKAALLHSWIHWAEHIAGQPLTPRRVRVAILDWCGVPILALPGEIFASTALKLRAELEETGGFVLCFADGNPGYLPPEEEYPHGGYEVDEAHRYYGLPATFAPGSAEKLAETALQLWRG